MITVGGAEAQGRFPGVGRAATPAEVRAWDIDVRRDFTGLPKGSGTVAKGQDVWDAKCASCHGTFAESNEVFPPIVGGTTKKDAEAGRVAGLRNASEGRTTLMKLAYLSTLWDYINRAMPWNAPKTLTVEEVYGVTAYILHLAELVSADFTLSDRNIAQVQAKLPNRSGLTRDHGLWEIGGKADVKNVACMRDCPVEAKDPAGLPAHARNAHGNLIAQHRVIGPVRGVDTTRPALEGPVGAQAGAIRAAALATLKPAAPVAAEATSEPKDGAALARQHACMACHAPEQKTVGPSLKDIAGKYRGDDKAIDALLVKVAAGGAGVWGDTPMPPQGHVDAAELRGIVQWMLGQQ